MAACFLMPKKRKGAAEEPEPGKKPKGKANTGAGRPTAIETAAHRRSTVSLMTRLRLLQLVQILEMRGPLPPRPSLPRPTLLEGWGMELIRWGITTC